MQRWTSPLSMGKHAQAGSAAGLFVGDILPSWQHIYTINPLSPPARLSNSVLEIVKWGVQRRRGIFVASALYMMCKAQR